MRLSTPVGPGAQGKNTILAHFSPFLGSDALWDTVAHIGLKTGWKTLHRHHKCSRVTFGKKYVDLCGTPFQWACADRNTPKREYTNERVRSGGEVTFPTTLTV